MAIRLPWLAKDKKLPQDKRRDTTPARDSERRNLTQSLGPRYDDVIDDDPDELEPLSPETPPAPGEETGDDGPARA